MNSRNKCFSILILIFFWSSNSLFAQKEKESQSVSIGISFLLNDHGTPQYLKFRKGIEYGIANNLRPGIGLNFNKQISEYLNLSFSLNGSFTDTAYTNQILEEKRLLTDLNTSINAYLVSDKKIVRPYFSAGFGVTNFHSKTSAVFPLGAGADLKISKEVFFRLQGQYLTQAFSDFIPRVAWGVSIFGVISKNTKPKRADRVENIIVSKTSRSLKDKDRDGIPDDQDECPEIAGIIALNGCPDLDGDGIADKYDDCPSVFGIEKYNGCPIPDRDQDGVNDEEDYCPDVPGHKNNNGCLVPQQEIHLDSNSVLNSNSTTQNRIIPFEISEVIDALAKKIHFKTGSATLEENSYSALDTLVSLINELDDFSIIIEGHADNSGSAAANLILSNDRAKAVKHYLINKGILRLRLESKGFGDTQPIDSNQTEEGRRNNRRVILRINSAKDNN